MSAAPRPTDLARALLEALEATEGRRRRRKRNTGADAIGIEMKRRLLERTVDEDPDPAAFEGWLLERCFEQGPGEGAWRAMALEIFHEWRMAEAAPSFRAWLDAGAPSDDRPGRPEERTGRPGRPRPGLPVLLTVLAMGLGAGPTACGGDEPGGDVPSIEVEEMDLEARQRTGMTAEVLGHMLDGPGPDSTIYDRPVDLTRPSGQAERPPATGTQGDEAVGAAPPDTTPVGPTPADTVSEDTARRDADS